MKRAGRIAICLAAGAVISSAAAPDNLHIHGVVQAFDGNTLTVKADNGKTTLVGIEPQTRIVLSRILTLSALKSGDYVATLSMQDAKGTLHVQSVRVLTNAPSVAGEGQYKLDTNPARIVTNGTVTTVTPSSGTLSLSFHGDGGDSTTPCTGRAPKNGLGCTGAADLLVARGVPITAVTTSDTSLLRPGAIVSVTANSDTASQLTASGISVEREGKTAQ